VRLRPAPRDARFYDLLTDVATNIAEAVEVLGRFVRADAADRAPLAEQMRRLEHVGDDHTHAIIELIDVTFVTPFDREDIYRLAVRLDDVVDYVDEVVDLATLYACDRFPDGVFEQVEHLTRAAELTVQAMPKLRTPKDLVPFWQQISQVENDADQTHRRLLSLLFGGEYEPLAVMKLKDLVDGLEEAADAFEHAADVMHTIAVKES
jgi:predicted phosphate transport protein (TIGR00153 family)